MTTISVYFAQGLRIINWALRAEIKTESQE
jgi:hypothetical protein